jgi:chromosome segregation ATPase
VALTGIVAQRDGWQHQAEGLALTHTALGMAAVAAAKHAGRRSSSRLGTSQVRTLGAESDRLGTGKTGPANELEPTRAELAAPAAAADKRIAILEGELASARQRLLLRENENHSLQVSLDLMADEKSRLTRRLAESNASLSVQADRAEAVNRRLSELETELGLANSGSGLRDIEDLLLQKSLGSVVKENERLSCRLTQSNLAVEKTGAQLKKMKAALTATEAERNRLAAALEEANKKLRTETRALNARLEAMSSHVIATEKQLADMRQRLLACTEQMRTVLITVEAERNQLAAAVDEVNEKRKGETRALNARLEAMASRAVAAEKQLAEARQNLLERTGRMETALVTMEAERNKLAVALQEANEKHRVETDTLNARLDTMSSRAVEAEKLPVEVRQSLLSRTEERRSAGPNIVDANVARNGANEKLDLLLIMFKARDASMTHAEARIKSLTEQVAQLKAQTAEAGTQENVEVLNSWLPREPVAEAAHDTVLTNCAATQREFDDHAGRNDRHSPCSQALSIEAILSSTITFGNAA